MNKIEIYPAIDLYDRKVVRLTGGDFEKIKEYGDDPVETALSFAEAGARWIHLIDLEGAEKGSPVHLKELEKVAASTGLPVQYGGGLRTEEDVALALSSGAKRVYLGSLLFKGSPKNLWKRFGNSIVPSVDVKNGTVALSGWTEVTQLPPEEAITELLRIGYSTFLVTSVSRDGTAAGPDLKLYEKLRKTDGRILAAGGIRDKKDLSDLAKIGVSGAVLGKSIYEGTVDLREAVEEFGIC